eukprot:1159373-Pelagomonas_calceolata.AAC.4
MANPMHLSLSSWHSFASMYTPQCMHAACKLPVTQASVSSGLPLFRVFFVEQRKYYNALMVKVTKRMQNIEIAAAFNKWFELIDIKREKEQRKSKCVRACARLMSVCFWLACVDEHAHVRAS